MAYLHIQCYFGWRHDEYQQLVEEARRPVDPAAWLALYRQVERILVQEAAIGPGIHNPTLHLLKPWVERCPIPPLNAFFTPARF